MTRNQARRLERVYNGVFTDNNIVDNVVGIVDELLDGKHQPSTLLTPWLTVQDFLRIKGSYAIPRIINDMVEAYVGRSIHHICLQLEIPINLDPRMIAFINGTDAQSARVVQPIIDVLVAKYGTPAIMDLITTEAIYSLPPEH
jgi:hypothetical protein